MSVFSDALKKANVKCKIANAQICSFWCVKLNFASKKCVNCNFSEIGWENEVVQPFKDWEEEDDWIYQSVNYEGVWRISQATPGHLNMVDFEPFFLLMAARQNVTTDCFYRTDMIKSVYNWQGQSSLPPMPASPTTLATASRSSRSWRTRRTREC